MNVAVIPARGGSKRIPRKNIKAFHGKPMIAWSIEVAKRSELFEKIVVSTDDREIASIAESHGAEVPFLRPSALADDHTATVPVIAHSIAEVKKMGVFPTAVCCIYPCAPFIRPEDLVAGLALLKESGANYSYPVTEYSHPVQRALTRTPGGKMQFLYPENELKRTQDLVSAFHDAGQFYWGLTSAWQEEKRMHSEGAGLLTPHWRVVDIDTIDDWQRAEMLYAMLAGQGGGSL